MKSIVISLITLLCCTAAYAQQPGHPAYRYTSATLAAYMPAAWNTLEQYQNGDTGKSKDIARLLPLMLTSANRKDIMPATRIEAACLAANIYRTNQFFKRDSAVTCTLLAESLSKQYASLPEVRAYYPNVMYILSYIAYIKGNKDEAIHTALQALDSLKKYPSDKTLRKVYSALGAYQNRAGTQESSMKAFDYFDKAARLAVKMGEYYVAKDMMLNQVEALMITEQMQKGSNYARRCDRIFRAIDSFCLQHNLQKQQLYYSMKGRMYHILGKFNLEITYEDSAVTVAGNNTSPNAMARHYYAKGRAYFEMGKLQQAKENFDKIRLAYFDPNAVISVLSYQHKIYAALGDSAKAYMALLNLKRVFDSTGLIELNQRTMAISKKYDVAQKDIEIARLETTEARSRTKMIIAAALFLLICVVYYFVHRRAKSRLQVSLQKINELSEMQLFRLDEATKQAKEEERIRIGMNLHDNLASTISAVSNFIHNHSSGIKDTEEAGKWMTIAQALDNAYETVRTKSHELYNQTQGKDIFMDMMRQNMLLYFSNTDIKTEIQIDESSLPFISSEIKVCLIYIIKEAATNILKHARATLVKFLLYTEEGRLILIITDNGKGMGSKQKRGIGLDSLYKRVRTLRGTMQITSATDKGTELEVSLPYYHF